MEKTMDKKLNTEFLESAWYQCLIAKTITKELFVLDLKYSEEIGGNEIKYKFRDPRDTLHFLIKNWKIISPIESSHLFDYVELGFDLGIYTQMEIYYMLVLRHQINFNLVYTNGNNIFDEYLNRNTSLNSKIDLLNKLKDFEFNLNKVTRESHIFAVKNTRLFWDIHKNNKISFNNNFDTTIFDETYLGKKVNHVLSFNLTFRLWTVYFDDGSWIIAGDEGNGWYKPLTKFNDYKLLGW